MKYLAYKNSYEALFSGGKEKKNYIILYCIYYIDKRISS